MRIGSGGVLLTHYSPYQVAENFRLAEILADPRVLVGDPDRVRDGLLRQATHYQPDEIMIVTVTWSWEARVRSYELVAEAMGFGIRDLGFGVQDSGFRG
jgi:alkanesulfonate monooxygenase SsuD/methylene tetrahydromethanopterin reductase-like flavin-dependent oxidoreductase (luciferase family)